MLNDNGRIYTQFDKATRDLDAWAILKGGEYVAKIVTRYTGRSNPNGVSCRAWVHVFGLPMATASTGPGGGYDMKTDAIARACAKIIPAKLSHDHRQQGRDMELIALNELAAKFRGLKDEGHNTESQLRDLGFTVCSVL